MTESIKLLYVSANAWGNMGRRKPRLAYEFARQADVSAVLYVDPPVSTSVLDLLRGRFEPSHLGQTTHAHARALLGKPRRVGDKLWAYTGSRKTLPLTRLGAIRRWEGLQRLNERLYYAGIRRALACLPGRRLAIWLSHPLQAGMLGAFPQRALACYDWTDDWTAFDVLPVADAGELAALNEQVLRQVDLVFTVSAELEQRARAVNPHTYRAPNATDPDVLGAAAVAGPVAPELAHMPRPIIGYVGQIADKMDYELIDQVAHARPKWSFVFVGPVWSSKQDRVARLQALDNVHFLGVRPFESLVGFLRGFDVCALPHVVSPLTRSMDPIKLYDYLATGKPIVSTPVAGLERFTDVVWVAGGLAGFVAALEVALRENGSLARKRLVCARANNWATRADEMWGVVQGMANQRVGELEDHSIAELLNR